MNYGKLQEGKLEMVVLYTDNTVEGVEVLDNLVMRKGGSGR